MKINRSPLFLVFLFSACGSNFVITPAGQKGIIDYHQNIVQLDLESELQAKKLDEINKSKDFEKKQKAWNILGHLIRGRTKIENALFEEDQAAKPINDFTITTTYTFGDLLLNLIPVASVRTVIYAGNYGDIDPIKMNYKKAQIDEELDDSDLESDQVNDLDLEEEFDLN